LNTNKTESGLKIAYFVNHYPKVSHTFIRREILALERQGLQVERSALRGWDEALPDPEDVRERERTHYVLKAGLKSLVLPAIGMFLRAPLRFCSALRLAVSLSRESDRPLPYHLIYLAEACYLVGWLARVGAQHVHAHFGTNSAEVALLAHVLGGPSYSFTVHGPDEFLRPLGLAEKIRRSAFVIAISSFGRSQLYARSCAEDWPKVKVVHCGLESAFYAGSAEKIPTAPRLVCVGRLCEAKGQLLLVEAAARVVAAGHPLELVLAGDGPLRAELEASIRKHSLEKHVRITGWISSAEVRREILASRALVLPSFAEGLPVVLMEAMALRRPVLTTYVAGIPELVRDGENGWVFPAGSVEDLAAAMEDCLARPVEQLQALGAAGFERVLERHSIDVEAGKLAELLRAATESG
jgi:colanic acid/amylovoran biosynthesis glycosyltransferase